MEGSTEGYTRMAKSKPKGKSMMEKGIKLVRGIWIRQRSVKT